MSFLNSLITVFTSFTMQIVQGFPAIPVTKLRHGAIFTNMDDAINYVDQNGQHFLGQAYGSLSVLAKPSFEPAQMYQPGGTTPPPAFPTSQPNGYQVPLGVNPAQMYQFSAEALRHLKTFDKLHQRPYVIEGVKYIGYAHRLSDNDSTSYVSRDKADAMLAADVAAVEGLVKGAISVPLTQGQFDALVDFAFTLSPQKFQGSEVVQKINGGDVPGAATAMAQWVYGNLNGVVQKFPHLTSRRTQNIQWLTMQINPQPPGS